VRQDRRGGTTTCVTSISSILLFHPSQSTRGPRRTTNAEARWTRQPCTHSIPCSSPAAARDVAHTHPHSQCPSIYIHYRKLLHRGLLRKCTLSTRRTDAGTRMCHPSIKHWSQLKRRQPIDRKPDNPDDNHPRTSSAIPASSPSSLSPAARWLLRKHAETAPATAPSAARTLFLLIGTRGKMEGVGGLHGVGCVGGESHKCVGGEIVKRVHRL
jgi:hypothetical protein